MNRFKKITAIAVALQAAVLCAGYVLFTDDRATKVTVRFTSATGLYPGDDVRVLGVPVGTVKTVVPDGNGARVTLLVDDDQAIPAKARAAIVTPSLVSGRFVQLAPAYVGGPKLRDGATIPVQRTAVPISFDEVKEQLNAISAALGPDGPTSARGSLRDAVEAVDENLAGGTAPQLRQSLDDMSEAAELLSGNRDDLFSTIRNLDTFTRALVENDAAVKGFTEEFAAVTDLLADNRADVAKVLDELDTTLTEVGAFAEENRTALTTSAGELSTLSQTLAEKSNTLAGVLHGAPHSLTGLYNVLEKNAITGRATLANLDSASQLLCGALLGVGGTAQQCRDALAPLLDLIDLPALTGTGGQDGASDATLREPAADVDAALRELEGLLGTSLLGGRPSGEAR